MKHRGETHRFRAWREDSASTAVVPWGVLAGVNERLVPQRGGRKLVLSSRYRAARDAVHLLTKGPPRDGPVRVLIELYPPDNRSDIDRFVKVILDGMQGKAYHDDKQVTVLEVRKYAVDAAPRVEVKVVSGDDV